MNVVSGLGTAKSKQQNNQWQYDALLNWHQLDAAYQSNWIARNIVDIPAEDMTRQWRTIKSDGAEEIHSLENEMTVPYLTQEALAWARLYGGAGMLMLTGQDLTKPLNLNRVKKGSLERLIVFDRNELSALSLNTWNVLAPNYGRPEKYILQNGAQEVHYSHFALFYGDRLPRRQLVQTQGWGDSVLRKCIEDVQDTVAAKMGIANAMQEFNVDVIKRQGLTDELASHQDQAIIARYDLFSQMKSVVNMALLDGNEELDRKTLNFSGISPIIEQFMTWISGASRIPLTKLFGTSAKGMNATGEGDERNYFNTISAMQNSSLMLSMRTLDEVLVRSALGHMPDTFDYIWNPLAQENGIEIAQAELLEAQKHIAYKDAGIVSTSQIQRNLQSTEQYQFDDEDIEELENNEDGNLFENLPSEGLESPVVDSKPKKQQQKKKGKGKSKRR